MRLLLLLLFPGILSAQQPSQDTKSFDVERYVVALTLNDSTNRIEGNAQVQFVCEPKVKTLFLDLESLENGLGMEVLKVLLNDASIEYAHKENKLIVQLPSNIEENGGGGVLSIEYAGVPKDGLIISNNKHGDRTFFADNWPNRAHNWFPCVDHPNDKAIIEFDITAPKKYTVVSNAELAKVEIVGNYKRWQFAETLNLPTKVMVIGVANFASASCGDTANVQQTAYVFPQEKDAGFSDYCMSQDILAWFESKIAPYPSTKLDHVQSKTRYGGMENAGCIFYYENSVDGKGSSEFLIAHEIAHQWFGNSATEKDWQHIWLSEGFATYLTEVYKQEVHGDTAFKSGMEQAKNKVIAFQEKYPNAKIVDTTIENLNQFLSPMTYQKAAWMLHMLRTIVGDDLFWDGVRNYYKKYQYGNASSADFQREMEMVCRCNLNDFFDSWLYQSGLPQVKIKYKYFKKTKQLMVKLKQKKKNWFVIPVSFGYNKNFKEVMDVPKMTILIDDATPPLNGVRFDYKNDVLMR